jgi:hypothetical protein
MALHEAEFESHVVNVYSEEMLMHYNAMDLERDENARHRKLCANDREIAERRAMGLSTKFRGLDFKSVDSVLDQKLHDLQKWIGAPNWTDSFESAKRKRMEDTMLWLQEDSAYQSWLTQKVPYPLQGSIFAKNILVVSGVIFPQPLAETFTIHANTLKPNRDTERLYFLLESSKTFRNAALGLT